MEYFENNSQTEKSKKRRMCRFDMLVGTFLKFFMIICFVLLLWVGCASAATLVISKAFPACTSGDEYFTSVQAAVDGAKEGDEIVVCPGTYIENIKVGKSLTIQSENGHDSTIIQTANSEDYVFKVTADYVKISGFSVKDAIGTGNAGIYIEADYCNVSNNKCSNNLVGISLIHSNNNSISNNNCSNNRWGGISLFDSNNNSIYNNNCSNNKYGIYLRWSNNNFIYLNDFINNTDNVYSYESTNAWNSKEKITFIYNETTYTNYLGNYWSDYTGIDGDKDGIGDTPYSIDTDKDNYPLMEPWKKYFVLYEGI